MSSIKEVNKDSTKFWQIKICYNSQLYIDFVFSDVKQFISIGALLDIVADLSTNFKEQSSFPF